MPAPELARTHSGRSERGTTNGGRFVIGEDEQKRQDKVTATDFPRYSGVQNFAEGRQVGEDGKGSPGLGAYLKPDLDSQTATTKTRLIDSLI